MCSGSFSNVNTSVLSAIAVALLNENSSVFVPRAVMAMALSFWNSVFHTNACSSVVMKSANTVQDATTERTMARILVIHDGAACRNVQDCNMLLNRKFNLALW